MNGFEIRLQPVVDWTTVLIATTVLLGLLFVRPRHVKLIKRQWAALVGLRLAVILLMFFALLRPSFVYTKTEPVPGSLLLLVDGSRSMQVADSLGDKPRWDAMKLLLDAAAKDLGKLAAKWNVTAYEFGGETKNVDLQDGKLTLAATPNGEESAIGAAIGDALDREASKHVMGMLLLSDGAQRAAPPHDMPPQIAARRLAAENIPLYTFTFGKSGGSERADLSLSDLVTNETIFTETPTEVRARLTALGYANQRVKVQLLWETPKGMEAVDTAQVDTGAEGGATPVVLRYTPQKPGEYKVTVRVDPREGELVTTNNEVSTFVTVRPGGINVLYLVGTQRIGGGPGQEQRFVRASLAQSPDIVISRRLINYQPPGADITDVIGHGKGGHTSSPEPDVTIVDNVDVQGLNDASWKAIADRVQHGMGLLMTGGYHSFGPGGYRGSPLADVLPMEIGPAQRQDFNEALRQDVQLPGPIHMQPAAPMGEQHPVMQIEGSHGGQGAAAQGGKVWNQLPPLDGANRIERKELKPNAQLLAEADDPQKHPLLIAGQAGEGRVLAFAGDSTWRWQMSGFGEAHRRFWRQVVLWLAKKDEHTDGKVWIKLAGRRVMRGSKVDFNVGADSAQGEPLSNAQFDIAVQTPDGHNESVRPTKDADGASVAFRETSKPGDYRIVVNAKDGGTELGTAEARFLVPNQDLELDRPAAEPTLMAQLAEMTKPAGGAAMAAEELPDLLKRLAAKPPELKEEVTAKVTYWDTWPFFLAFVGLLGGEWYLRKRWGMV
ncbi:MAG TPA: glutamine amidotransferase [Lacipirellulaceae bacterium]|jgi:uncharacterized membrane protein|nr:glutamine amidotransferase [Lacipirellulaceae bacterium]